MIVGSGTARALGAAALGLATAAAGVTLVVGSASAAPNPAGNNGAKHKGFWATGCDTPPPPV